MRIVEEIYTEVRNMARAQAGYVLPPVYDPILGVRFDTPKREARHAWLNAARQAHPDTGGSHESMKCVNEAYARRKVRIG